MAKKTIKAWGGFSGGRLYSDEVDTGFGGYGNGTTKMRAVFDKRADAKKQYRDVRRIEITYETGK